MKTFIASMALATLALVANNSPAFATTAPVVANGAKARELFDALGGNAVAETSVRAGVTLMTLKVKDVECVTKRDREDDEVLKSFVICSATIKGFESNDYLGLTAHAIRKALADTGASTWGEPSEETVGTPELTCQKLVKSSKATYRCTLAN